MIFPLSTNPADVNVAMIRIADENNKDIDEMAHQIDGMKEQQQELKDRYQSQQDRWSRYRDAYQYTLDAYHIQGGNVSVDRMLELMPWSQLQ